MALNLNHLLCRDSHLMPCLIFSEMSSLIFSEKKTNVICFCLCWAFMAPLIQEKVMSSQSINLFRLFPGRFDYLSDYSEFCAHTFASKWKMPFVNQQKRENDHRNDLKRENDHRNDFLITLNESYVAELGFELVTSSDIAVRCASNCTMEHGNSNKEANLL